MWHAFFTSTCWGNAQQWLVSRNLRKKLRDNQVFFFSLLLAASRHTCAKLHTLTVSHFSRLKFKAFAKTLFSEREMVELFLKSDLLFITCCTLIQSIKYSVCMQKVVLSIIGMGMAPSIIDEWGYDREFCHLCLFFKFKFTWACRDSLDSVSQHEA